MFGHADRPALPLVMAILRKVDKDGVHQEDHALMGAFDSQQNGGGPGLPAAGQRAKKCRPTQAQATRMPTRRVRVLIAHSKTWPSRGMGARVLVASS